MGVAGLGVALVDIRTGRSGTAKTRRACTAVVARAIGAICVDVTTMQADVALIDVITDATISRIAGSADAAIALFFLDARRIPCAVMGSCLARTTALDASALGADQNTSTIVIAAAGDWTLAIDAYNPALAQNRL